MYVVLSEGVVIVGVTGTSGSHVTVTGQTLVSFEQWNYLLIQLE